MSNVIAGVVRGQIPYLEEHIAHKKAIYMRYKEAFKDLPLKMNPYDEVNSEPNFWLSCLIIDENAEVRQCAFIRGNAIIGKGATVGNSTELKNSILFDEVQTPHFNYIGDSILGYKSHTGAGAITSNLKSDKSLVTVLLDGEKVETGVKKFGAMLGDNVEVGCNSVLNPGTVIGKNTNVYPLSFVRGYVAGNSIYKRLGEIAEKI